MYRIAPPAVYAHESVMANATYRSRVENVVAALQEPREIITYRDDDLPDMIGSGLLDNRVNMGKLPIVQDPILLFNTFRFDSREEVQKRATALRDRGIRPQAPLLGTGAFAWAYYDLKDEPDRNHKVCRRCWRIHLQQGCLHRCNYCSLGGLLVSMVNVEDYCRQLGTLMEKHPWQETYLLEDDADAPGLEPELGCLGYLVEYFGTLRDRYLLVHTKSANVEWMTDLRHNGNTIMLWSLSGPTQSRELEPRAGTTEERIEAARIAQQAGFPIRYKFKPIIPVRTWREDAVETIRLLFDRTQPDLISLCCLVAMPFAEMRETIPLELLDPEYVRKAESSAPAPEDTRAKPFPHDVRAEIYDFYIREIRKHNTDVPVSLCAETGEMWNEFGEKLGFTETNYVCGCGPQSTPGRRKLSCHPFDVAVRNDSGTTG